MRFIPTKYWKKHLSVPNSAIFPQIRLFFSTIWVSQIRPFLAGTKTPFLHFSLSGQRWHHKNGLTIVSNCFLFAIFYKEVSFVLLDSISLREKFIMQFIIFLIQQYYNTNHKYLLYLSIFKFDHDYLVFVWLIFVVLVN